MSTDTTAAPRRRSPFARREADSGPRARFSQLLPYLLEHRGVLSFVVVLSVLGAAASGAPGPLVSHFAGTDAGALPIPLMIIPGSLDRDAIDRLS